ncbi:MAG: C25 family cysteine peptidase [Fulvivirga sp.]|uniref:putative type IX secretion system sortase PorU2 n=2 Tax=Fulvivirga sp. TaxID=1931237 RepID=UPI0032F0558B
MISSRRIVLVFLLLVSHIGYSQLYGDEWIDYNKKYYKVTLAQDGLYRISYADLTNAGFPINSVDPRRLQLFHKGVEQAIFVQGQGDAVFNTTDYIEFYGVKNDGKADERLYKPAEAQPHQFYSIYSDSSAYFLTWHLTTTNGKRMTSYSENNTGGLIAQTSHLEEKRLINTAQYSSGQGYSTNEYTRLSSFDYGEGWTSAAIQENNSADFVINGITNGVQADGVPSIELLLTGRDDLPHNVDILVGTSTATLRNIGNVQFDNYESLKFTSDLLWTDISAGGSITVRVTALGVSGGNDRISTSYIRLFYPQNFNVQSSSVKVFNLKTEPSNKSYVEFSNVPNNTQLYDVTDTDNVIRIGSNQAGSDLNAVINGTAIPRRIFINSQNFITPVVKRAPFRDINASSHDYIILSHSQLMKPTGNVNDPVKAYASYRASSTGGGYDTLVVDIDMLYNQYNYGIKNPLAIFDFMRFMVNNGDPKYLFIIGKGLDPSINFYRNATGSIPFTRQGITYQAKDLVPTSGNPGSDMLFTAGLSGEANIPAVPVGRIPALTPAQVNAYLNKVIEMEGLPFDDLWRKNVLHLSGGITVSELVVFRAYMKGFENIAVDDYLGGDVKTVAKTSGSTIQLINVADEVNKGLSLITFYGHSAPNITDIDIGYATDPELGYNNAGKYPMFLINGCNAGAFFRADFTFGEDWILAENKGAIGFIAHSSFGFSGNLRRYSNTFYDVGYGDSVFVSKPIADVQQEVGRRYLNNVLTDPTNVSQTQQMVLLGDPAVNLFGPENPDYEITNDNLYIDSFTEEPVTAKADSFALKMIVKNYGRTRSDSIRIAVSRTLQDNSILEYDSVFAPINYLDTISFRIIRGEENGFGNNRFSVQLDYLSEIPELNENNNTASLDYFIPLFGTRNIYPNDYAIVAEQPVELLIQSSNILEKERQFSIEIDTVNTFDSPFLKQNSLNARLLASWKVDLLNDVPLNDSTVYYWRSKYADIQPGESDEWVTSSFTYIKDSPEGWSQSAYNQLENSVISSLQRNDDKEEFDFLRTFRDVQITTFGAANPALNSEVSVLIDGTEYIINNGFGCRDNTVNLIAFDKNTAIPYAAVPFLQVDSKTCGRVPQIIDSFTFSEIESVINDNLITYIDNLQEGDSVVFFTIGDPQVANWSANIKTKLEEIGALSTDFDAVVPGEPYILVGKKGAPPGAAQQLKTTVSPEAEQQIQLTLKLSGVESSGKLASSLIGPAKQWGSVIANASISELPKTDEFTFDVIGMGNNGNEQVLMNDVTNFPLDLSSVNANQYPYLKLVINIADDINLTPPQLEKWLVLFTPVPEGIFIAKDENTEQVTIQEGVRIQKSYGFKNISKQPFLDSLEVKQQQFNIDSRKTTNETFRIKAPLPGDTTMFNIDLVSLGFTGDNDLRVEVNPQLEPELFYDNNTLDLKRFLTVEKDNINPLLDVLFDGRYILNGDIVSPSPLITIQLKDENPYIMVTDTTSMNIFLRKECEGCNSKRVNFSSNEVQWFAATEQTSFNVEYKPSTLEDGRYTLSVQASDASGNLSGDDAYSISFEVINESTITNFYPYPNPFSTSTKFIFTLTGSEVPQEIRIQVMTVSGKIVREITQDELGIVRIGNNISDYAWDGRDEFGDKLANGVYLYKVIVKQNGQSLKQRSTSADKAFTKGFGKLYILR